MGNARTFFQLVTRRKNIVRWYQLVIVEFTKSDQVVNGSIKVFLSAPGVLGNYAGQAPWKLQPVHFHHVTISLGL